jgi:hypothetical protein
VSRRRNEESPPASPQELDALLEDSRIEDWKEAGAPDPMAMWLDAQGPDAAPAADPSRAEWSTVGEVAARHRLSAKTVRRDIGAGRLQAHDGPPKPYRIKREDEDLWAEARRTPGARPRTPKSTPKRKPTTTFRDMVKKGSA